MRSSHGKKIGYIPVISALAGNFSISAMKFAAFAVSGSSVMFSEAIHSFADTLNQSLLLVGIKRSTKKPSTEFVYGHGPERFLWALISACGIFFLGAGVTIYNGIEAWINKEAVHLSAFVFVVLAVSFVVETITLAIALKELVKYNPGKGFVEALKTGDPSTLAVVYEDGVAVLGVLVAFLSIGLTHLTGNYRFDAIGSIIVGSLLAFIAIVLIIKNSELLINKAIPEEMKDELIGILEADPSIEKVIDFKSSILDVGVYRVKCEVEFNGPSLLKELYEGEDLKEEYEALKDDYQQFVKFCADYVDRVPRLIGSKINRIEEKVQKEMPEIRHIDIEIN